MSNNAKIFLSQLKRRSLLLLIIVITLSIGIGATTITSYNVLKELLLQSLKQQALLKAEQGRDEIDQWLALRKTEIKTLANSPLARSIDWDVINPYLQSEVKRLQTFLLMAVVKTDGTLINTEGSRLNAKDREFFQRGIAGETSTSDPIIGRTTKKLQIQISSPIPAATGTSLAGVLMGGIPIDKVVEVISNLHQGKDSYAFALNSQGVPIAHPNQNLIGSPEKPADSFLKSANPKLAAITQQMVSGQTNIELLQLDGKWNYIAYTPLKEANWSVAIVVPRENIESPLQALNVLAVVLGSLLIVALIGAWRQVQMYEKICDHALSSSQQAQQLTVTLKELQRTQARLLQTEKMSSLGQLVAGVAHEINNPISFIHGNLTHVKEYSEGILNLLELYQQTYTNPTPQINYQIEELDIEFLIKDLPHLINSMREGTTRIRQIVLSLRNFARLDEADMKFVDIHEGLENTLMILNSRLQATPTKPEINIIKEYGNLPLVGCYAGQINQVFMNILTNAIDALHESNQSALSITLRTFTKDKEWINISIADNGIGIIEENKQRIFDPFFTTKPVGKGTGLGLAIAYQLVVEQHTGMIEVNSILGKGTEFSIVLPMKAKTE
ncbi:sensor histidine kinase [Iningainema tapete]|uniref:histidine kinase n=1 Tax=Iningainema tapete BLCC-T55 TaxID=2748662 RepID=A0A8J6XNU1_9CYAN|nr:ATP-binding protein [Iningainema tapete]MBD2776471.1 histidine kinase [Iningainema tapete BLCC-T55]